MPGPTWTLTAARSRFGGVVDAAQREPQAVTRRGKPVAVVLSAEDHARLRRLERSGAPTFTEHLLAMPAGGEGFDRLEGRLRES